MELNLPVIQSRTRYVAKDTAFAAEYDDAFHVGPDGRRVAIADGVSSAIFSGRWARILTRALVETPPDFSQPDGWVKWLADPRQAWMIDIDFPRMPPHQKTKLRQVGGAYCTICTAEFLPLGDAGDGPGGCLLRAFAMGDSCLLQVRDGQLVTSFPLASSAEFDLDPDSVCSVATSRDSQLQLKSVEIECREGDVVILVTDAIGKWIFERLEHGEAAPWEQLWSLDEPEWIAAIDQLRDCNALKRDDTTMVVLQVGGGPPVWDAPAPSVDLESTPESEWTGEPADAVLEPDQDVCAAAVEECLDDAACGDADSESDLADAGSDDSTSVCDQGIDGAVTGDSEILCDPQDDSMPVTDGTSAIGTDENGPIGA